MKDLQRLNLVSSTNCIPAGYLVVGSSLLAGGIEPSELLRIPESGTAATGRSGTRQKLQVSGQGNHDACQLCV